MTDYKSEILKQLAKLANDKKKIETFRYRAYTKSNSSN